MEYKTKTLVRAEEKGAVLGILVEPISIVYVELLSEGTKCYRPVIAHHLNGDIWSIDHQFQTPPGEEWAFPPGSCVICEKENINGSENLVVKKRFNQSSEPVDGDNVG